MFEIGQILFYLAAATMLAIGLRFSRTPAPLDYHAAILASDGTPTTDSLLGVLTALYRVIGGAFVAMGLLVAFVAHFVLTPDSDLILKFLLPFAILCGGAPAVTAPRRIEQMTGIRTPWRIALLVVLIGLVAGALTIL